MIYSAIDKKGNLVYSLEKFDNAEHPDRIGYMWFQYPDRIDDRDCLSHFIPAFATECYGPKTFDECLNIMLNRKRH